MTGGGQTVAQQGGRVVNGGRWMWRVVVGACVAAMVAPVLAQTPAPRSAPVTDVHAGRRYQLALMEGVLEAAVQQGARIVSRQWRQVSSETLFISGNARARGIPLEGYGVLFDVAVPSMRQSVAWTWRMLDRESAAASDLQLLRGLLKSVTDPLQKREIDLAIRRLELQVGPVAPAMADPVVVSQADPGRTGDPTTRPAPTAAGAAGRDDLEALMEDPGELYTREVQKALMDAMLDHSHALALGPDEFLTVAAYDEAGRITGSDLMEPKTILFRIRGNDLQAFRAGRLTRDDARKRIEVREY